MTTTITPYTAALASTAKILRQDIIDAWCDREHTVPRRGALNIPPFREGGLTDALITIAVAAAQQHIGAAYSDGFDDGFREGWLDGHATGFDDGLAESDCS